MNKNGTTHENAPVRDYVERPSSFVAPAIRDFRMYRPTRTHRYTPEELARYEDTPARQHVETLPETGPVKVGGRNRGGRRSTQDMLATMPTALEKADYALGRIRRHEDQIAELLAAVGKDAATLIINERPSLRKYLRN